uniref:Uncharacterized protein n=1 Tax=Arundo donax TaxID=35708 RepID=A0A0A9G921_ARUDO
MDCSRKTIPEWITISDYLIMLMDGSQFLNPWPANERLST